VFVILPDSSGVVSRDESLGIRNNLRLRQEALDKECQDKYRDSDGSCFYTDVDNSGGSYGSCICWYDDYLDEGSDWCGENLHDDACYYDSYLITLGPNEVSQGGCACPPPGNDA
jgi:hypothetical protein